MKEGHRRSYPLEGSRKEGVTYTKVREKSTKKGSDSRGSVRNLRKNPSGSVNFKVDQSTDR